MNNYSPMNKLDSSDITKYFGPFATCPLFQCKNIKKLKEELSSMLIEYSSYEKEEIILGQGMVTKNIFLIIEGSVQLLNEDNWGRKSILGIKTKSEVFAEALAITRNRASFSAVAREQSLVAAVPVDKILENREYAANLTKILAGTNQTLFDHCATLSQKTVRDRLLYFLSLQREQHHANTFILAMNRKTLASLLGIDQGSLSKEIQKLEKEKMLIVRDTQFTLC